MATSEKFKSLLGLVSGGQDLSSEQMQHAIGQVMTGKCSEEQIGLLLASLAAKGETVAELAGAATAMRENMTPIRSRHAKLLDTCGTGGGGSSTFNISTTAALVIAQASPWPSTATVASPARAARQTCLPSWESTSKRAYRKSSDASTSWAFASALPR